MSANRLVGSRGSDKLTAREVLSHSSLGLKESSEELLTNRPDSSNLSDWVIEVMEELTGDPRKASSWSASLLAEELDNSEPYSLTS